MRVEVSAEAPAFELAGVTRRFGDLVALGPTSLTIAQGEAVAIVGPSGAGKTTLLHVLGGVDQPDAGTVRLLGRDLGGLRPGPELSSLVGVLHQQFDLVPTLSVLQNVLAGNLGRWGLGRSLWSLVRPQETAGALAALRRVGLQDRARERAGRLSGGEQQRVALARLLVQDPQVLLADEPVSSLDPARAAELVRLLVSMARDDGRTLVASLHSIDLALEHFDRVMAFRGGELLFDQPAHAVQRPDLELVYALEAAEVTGDAVGEPGAP